jgi:hypothetical protein
MPATTLASELVPVTAVFARSSRFDSLAGVLVLHRCNFGSLRVHSSCQIVYLVLRTPEAITKRLSESVTGAARGGVQAHLLYVFPIMHRSALPMRENPWRFWPIRSTSPVRPPIRFFLNINTR